MKTVVIRVNPQAPEPEAVAEAVAVLRSGGLVVFPTETVYGLAARAFDVQAVQRVFAVKRRPAGEPLPVQVASAAGLARVVRRVLAQAERLLQCFAPGPITIVLHAERTLPESVTAGTGKVGIRIPADPVAQAILQAMAEPLVVTSANRHGRPAPADAQTALRELKDEIELVLDGGQRRLAQESTVIDLTQEPPKILRQGSLSREAIESLIGPVVVISRTKGAQEHKEHKSTIAQV